LQDQSDIKEAHEAWCDVVFAHQAAFYGHMYGNQSENSISKNPSDFFQEWVPWPLAAKLLYNRLIAAVGFSKSCQALVLPQDCTLLSVACDSFVLLLVLKERQKTETNSIVASLNNAVPRALLHAE
jgi:hypothetical protein